MPVPRTAEPTLRRLAEWYPVVVVTGPRQSGKSTLCRLARPDLPYVNLESAADHALWQADPVGMIRHHPHGAVLNEVQRLPALASALQVEVDADPRPGRWLLTGSENLAIRSHVSQSLAGRSGHLHLLPLTTTECAQFPDAPDDVWHRVFRGGYPRIYDRKIPAPVWLADYVATYVTRDVRDILNVRDVAAYATFLRLAAGRTAQEVNLASLGADTGITQPTARAWISTLEAMWLVHRLPRWSTNITSQAVKAPKLHFLDTGLVCNLLGIREAAQLVTHPLRGAIFETWVATELIKRQLNAGRPLDLQHFRDAGGAEVDIVLGAGEDLVFIDVKSSETPDVAALSRLNRLAAKLPGGAARVVIYAGARTIRLASGTLLSWRDLDSAPELARWFQPAG
ncbi:hypothetical protein LBMAG42_00360 [Deltaproteobacteria bacterium]|nr:hypothetical protein LBMAG42_00360 [Deltaproteobacteria bacterium]